MEYVQSAWTAGLIGQSSLSENHRRVGQIALLQLLNTVVIGTSDLNGRNFLVTCGRIASYAVTRKSGGKRVVEPTHEGDCWNNSSNVRCRTSISSVCGHRSDDDWWHNRTSRWNIHH